MRELDGARGQGVFLEACSSLNSKLRGQHMWKRCRPVVARCESEESEVQEPSGTPWVAVGGTAARRFRFWCVILPVGGKGYDLKEVSRCGELVHGGCYASEREAEVQNSGCTCSCRNRKNEREREKIRSRELTRKCDHGGLRFEGPMCGTPSPCFVDAAGARPGKKAGEWSFAAARQHWLGKEGAYVCRCARCRTRTGGPGVGRSGLQLLFGDCIW